MCSRNWKASLNRCGRRFASASPIKTPRMTLDAQGELHYADVMVYPLMADGASGAVIRMDDVTARVRIESMMVQTEKMLSVGGLAAGMAHEINNPLGAILQGSQNILRRIDPRYAAKSCGGRSYRH
jgi:nitrogen-specific signal transduction histidine kinase